MWKSLFPQGFGFFFSFIISAKLRKPQKITLCYRKKYLFSCQFYSNSTLQILYALTNTAFSPNQTEKKKGRGRKRWSKMCPEEPNMLFRMMWLRHATCSQLVGTWRWCGFCASLLLTPEHIWKSFHLLLDLTEAWNIANQCVLRHSNMSWALHYISFWLSWSVAVFCH